MYEGMVQLGQRGTGSNVDIMNHLVLRMRNPLHSSHLHATTDQLRLLLPLARQAPLRLRPVSRVLLDRTPAPQVWMYATRADVEFKLWVDPDLHHKQ